MKKLLVLLTASVILFGCSCSGKIVKSRDNTDGQIHFDYPDQLVFSEGGSASMTIYRCGTCFYACDDGGQSWSILYSAPLELEDGEFIHVDAEYELVYGGVAGYTGNKYVKEVSNEKELTFDEVVDMRIIPLYDRNEGAFSGLRLITKDGKNYLLCRDPLLQYRLYDENSDLLCTYDAPMACVSYLEDGADNTIDYGSSANLPFYVMRIGDVYYAYSNNAEFCKWTPLLNIDFENKPVGFELEDGQTVKIGGSRVYKINGGKDNYVNAPMFEKTDRIEDINYSTINSKASVCRWEQCISYENGDLYRYMFSGEEYLIFYIDDRFYVYYEKGSDPSTDAFLGTFDLPEEVNNVIGWQ